MNMFTLRLALAVGVATSAAFASLDRSAAAAAPIENAASREKHEAGQRQLALADTYVNAGAWDKAIESFSKAADSENPIIASRGRTGLLDALNAKNAGALGLRAELPAPLNRWWALDYVVYGLIAIILTVILVPLAMAAVRIFKRDPSKSPWRVSVSGSAEEPNRSVVFDEFVITMRGLRETGPTVRALSSVGPTESRFFTPLSLADLVGPDLVVRGIDVSRIAATAQRFRDHFSYGFELRVDKLDNHAYVYASLRWGGRVEKSWQIPSLAERAQFNFRETGRQLAFAIHGDNLVRR